MDFGLLDDTAIKVGEVEVSPLRFMIACLAPKLQFAATERDLALIRVETWGLKDGKKQKITYDLYDQRDLKTGLFAMNRTVGFTSSIGAQMILSGKITQAGVLSPARHVPPHQLIKEAKARGMIIDYCCR